MLDTGRRTVRGGWGGAARALFMAGLVAVGGGLFARADAQDEGGHPDVGAAARKAVAASTKIVALTKDVYKTGNAPRQTDPAFGPLLDAVFDVAIVRKTDLNVADGDALAEWLHADLQIGTVYITAGTGVTNLTRLREPSLREQSDRDVAAYAPEVGRYLDAQIVLETALIETVFKDKADPGDAMLRTVKAKMSAGLLTSLEGAVGTLAITGLSYDWRLDRLATLEATAPKFSKFLDAAQCGKLAKVTTLVSDKVKDSRVTEKLQAFRAKLSCS